MWRAWRWVRSATYALSLGYIATLAKFWVIPNPRALMWVFVPILFAVAVAADEEEIRRQENANREGD